MYTILISILRNLAKPKVCGILEHLQPSCIFKMQYTLFSFNNLVIFTCGNHYIFRFQFFLLLFI